MKRNRFNLFAGIFGRLWFAAQLMLLELLVISCLDILLNVLIGIMAVWNGQDQMQRNLIIMTAFILSLIIKFLVYGFYGNQLLEYSKRNVSNVKIYRLQQFEERFRKHEKTVVIRGTVVVLYLIWMATCQTKLADYLLIQIVY